jgi:hypothetical protein
MKFLNALICGAGLPLLALTGVFCTQPQAPEPKIQKGPPPVFQFSAQNQIAGKNAEGNWCYRYYSQAVPVSAPLDNSNRRFFDAPPGIYKVIVPLGTTTASTIIKSYGAHRTMEVFTSDHFPECLSNTANFQISPDGSTLLYDNRGAIRFTVTAQPNGPYMRIILDMPVGAGYGIEVRLCDNCED